MRSFSRFEGPCEMRKIHHFGHYSQVESDKFIIFQSLENRRFQSSRSVFLPAIMAGKTKNTGKKKANKASGSKKPKGIQPSRVSPTQKLCDLRDQNFYETTTNDSIHQFPNNHSRKVTNTSDHFQNLAAYCQVGS